MADLAAVVALRTELAAMAIPLQLLHHKETTGPPVKPVFEAVAVAVRVLLALVGTVELVPTAQLLAHPLDMQVEVLPTQLQAKATQQRVAVGLSAALRRQPWPIVAAAAVEIFLKKPELVALAAPALSS
jgi:hypothetical protein